MKKITIVLADDHNVVRQGLRAILETQHDFSVVGEASDGLEAVRVVERTAPDVLVVDILMPGITGVEVLRQVTERSPKTATLVLSVENNEIYIRDALTNGAAGYLVKDAPAEDLMQAIREVAAGKRYLSPALSEVALSAYVKRSQSTGPDSYENLTSREREVLHLAAQGLTNNEIAKRLYISPRTVEVHRASMMHKLGLRKPVDLILYALRRGILPAEMIADEPTAKPADTTQEPRKRRKSFPTT